MIFQYIASAGVQESFSIKCGSSIAFFMAMISMVYKTFTVPSNLYACLDSHELIRSLLDALDESQKIPCSYDFLSAASNPDLPKLPPFNRHSSFVTDLFQGRIISEVKCFHCGNISATQEPFFDLSLELPKDQQLKRVTAESKILNLGSLIFS